VANLHNGQPHPSNFGYAYAKRMLEVQSRAYRAQWGSDYIVAIPTNIYGPHDNFSLTEGHVVPALIHKVYLAQSMETPLVVWGSGTPLREFIFSQDVARLTLWMLENYFEPEPLILSASSETSIKELTKLVIEKFNFLGEVIYDKNQPEGQHRKPSNCDPLTSILPNFKFTPLDVGLDETISWFKGNYPEIRM
jgi:GDP-L-fucose synthase